MSAVLECRGVNAGYGQLAVARDVNLELSSGQVLALLGPNGAGKTTLLTTLAGLLPRISGEVLVDGAALPNGRAQCEVRLINFSPTPATIDASASIIIHRSINELRKCSRR